MSTQSPQSPKNRPHSPQVYRRRRLVVGLAALIALAVVLALIFWVAGLVRGTGDDDSPSGPTEQTSEPTADASDEASPSPSASDEASPSPSASDESADETEAAPESTCEEDQLSVTAATDQSEYGSDEEPVFEMSITNDGDQPCDTNVGSNQQVFTVTSGSDRIFATTDCQVEGNDQMMTLEPGQTETSRFTWSKVRTQPGCEESTEELSSGTYQLEVAMGSVTSESQSFTLNQE